MKINLVGGFLGSGKTTAISKASKQLQHANKKVAVITNDQGKQLVDSSFMKSNNIPVSEVTNGCFCCNYDQLNKQIHALFKIYKPDMIFAESVGSCTDLIATVAKPLEKFNLDLEIVISIFVDANLLASLLSAEDVIAENLKYIFEKQIEEADILIINKIDLVSNEVLSKIKMLMSDSQSGKMVIYQNSMKEKSIQQWLHTIEHFKQPAFRQSLELDYDQYGRGEAELAWFDKTIILKTPQGDAITITEKFILNIQNNLLDNKLSVGHLKFFIETDKYQMKISFTNIQGLTHVDLPKHEANEIRILINARIQTEPEILSQIIDDGLDLVIDDHDCKVKVEHCSAFKPGIPSPTYRISN